MNPQFLPINDDFFSAHKLFFTLCALFYSSIYHNDPSGNPVFMVRSALCQIAPSFVYMFAREPYRKGSLLHSWMVPTYLLAWSGFNLFRAGPAKSILVLAFSFVLLPFVYFYFKRTTLQSSVAVKCENRFCKLTYANKNCVLHRNKTKRNRSRGVFHICMGFFTVQQLKILRSDC